MELLLANQMLSLTVHGTTLKSSFALTDAAPKMIIALHESHTDLANRKVWFNKVVMTCTDVRVGAKWLSVAQSKIQFGQTIIDKKLINAVIMPTTLSATMKKPA